MHVAALLFVIGLLIWTAPLIASGWKIRTLKTLSAGVQLIIVIASAVIARAIVASVIQLPPQDFDLTVAVLSIPIFVAFWAIISSVISVLFFVAMLLWALLLNILANYIIPSIALIAIFAFIITEKFLSNSSKRNLDNHLARFVDFLERKRNPLVAILKRDCIHMAGALSILVYTALSFNLAGENKEKIEVAIKRIAYYSDYHTQNRNYKSCSGFKAILHPNGLVSYAVFSKSKGAEIIVGSIEDRTVCSVVEKTARASARRTE